MEMCWLLCCIFSAEILKTMEIIFVWETDAHLWLLKPRSSLYDFQGNSFSHLQHGQGRIFEGLIADLVTSLAR